MREHTKEKHKALADHDETHHELSQIREEHKQRVEERTKREEILQLMKKKDDEQ